MMRVVQYGPSVRTTQTRSACRSPKMPSSHQFGSVCGGIDYGHGDEPRCVKQNEKRIVARADLDAARRQQTARVASRVDELDTALQGHQPEHDPQNAHARSLTLPEV